MKTSMRLVAAAMVLAMSFSVSAAKKSEGPLLIVQLTDANRLYLREFVPGLLLSVRKQPTPSGGHVGWGIEVLRRPITADAPNLLQSRTGVVVHAADIASRKVRYPQVMQVSGTPYQLRVDLVKEKVQGKGKDAQFTTGTLEIEWQEK